MNSRWDRLNRKIVRCQRCPRLRTYCERVAIEKKKEFLDWDYWGKPAPNFGDPDAELLLVGLAPAAHGANRTGRLFTGDRSGDWLYRALWKAGFATQPESTHRDDGLVLLNAAIGNVCHCAPPDNKPTREEMENCAEWLETTLKIVPARVILALGQIAWQGVVDAAKKQGLWTGARPQFGHAACVELADGRPLLGCYHPSPRNTFTGRLTEDMLDGIFAYAKELLRRTG